MQTRRRYHHDVILQKGAKSASSTNRSPLPHIRGNMHRYLSVIFKKPDRLIAILDIFSREAFTLPSARTNR